MENLLKVLIDVRNKNINQLDAYDQIIADIRNKLSPISNLVALIEHDAPKEYILKQLEQVKESIKYLSDK